MSFRESFRGDCNRVSVAPLRASGSGGTLSERLEDDNDNDDVVIPTPKSPMLTGYPSTSSLALQVAHAFDYLTGDLPQLKGRVAALLPGSLPLLMSAPRGDGHPVLLVPGFVGDAGSMVVLKRYLRNRGYEVDDWGLGRNVGFQRKHARALKH